MSNSSVYHALEELRAEYDTVTGEVAELQNRLAAMESRLDRLRDAIQSLERLGEPTVANHRQPSDDAGETQERDAGDDDLGSTDEPAEPEFDSGHDGSAVAALPQDSPILAYLSGGDGKRLKSTQMVIDVVNDDIDRWVTREQLKHVFFQRFPREDMDRLWDRPDNAFGNALLRAHREKRIRRGLKGDIEVFTSHAVANRLREEKEATNRKADEEDQ